MAIRLRMTRGRRIHHKIAGSIDSSGVSEEEVELEVIFVLFQKFRENRADLGKSQSGYNSLLIYDECKYTFRYFCYGIQV
jgi:hypothetical protein